MLEPTYVSLMAAIAVTLLYLKLTGCLRLIGDVLMVWIKVLILGVSLVGGILIGPFLPYWFYSRCMDALEPLITLGDSTMLVLLEEIRRDQRR